MFALKVTKCSGEGQGSCKRCSDKGIFNRTWMCFLYRIEGFEGCYCRKCAEEIVSGFCFESVGDNNAY